MTVESVPPRANESLDQWLDWLETIHPVAVDMGLDRAAAAADQLNLRPVTIPIITVAGTNGKGSTVTMLSAIYSEAGYRVGSYTSPHIDNFCERIRINGRMVGEQVIVDALAYIEHGRADLSLTYFEYTTLAAMRIFVQGHCDVVILEVGLGGRLDATNIWDAECAILTSIALDHQEYLGSDVSVIATEKAAIGRRGKPMIVGEVNPPQSLAKYAENMGFLINHVGALADAELPETGLAGDHQRRNAGCAVAAVSALQHLLPVSDETVSLALKTVYLAARFERTQAEGVTVITDAAHNPASARSLCDAWMKEYPGKKCEMIFASLSDKDLQGIVVALLPIVASWHCIGLTGDRAAPVKDLGDVIKRCSSSAVVVLHDEPATAWRDASERARLYARPVLVAGSFHTITAVRSVMYHAAQASNLPGMIAVDER